MVKPVDSLDKQLAASGFTKKDNEVIEKEDEDNEDTPSEAGGVIQTSREEESAAAAATTLDHFAMQLYHPVAADQVDQSCSSSIHNSRNSLQLSPFHHHQFHPYRLQPTQPNSCKK